MPYSPNMPPLEDFEEPYGGSPIFPEAVLAVPQTPAGSPDHQGCNPGAIRPPR
jgi:hypothetical protein